MILDQPSAGGLFVTRRGLLAETTFPGYGQGPVAITSWYLQGGPAGAWSEITPGAGNNHIVVGYTMDQVYQGYWWGLQFGVGAAGAEAIVCEDVFNNNGNNSTFNRDLPVPFRVNQGDRIVVRGINFNYGNIAQSMRMKFLDNVANLES